MSATVGEQSNQRTGSDQAEKYGGISHDVRPCCAINQGVRSLRGIKPALGRRPVSESRVPGRVPMGGEHTTVRQVLRDLAIITRSRLQFYRRTTLLFGLNLFRFASYSRGCFSR